MLQVLLVGIDSAAAAMVAEWGYRTDHAEDSETAIAKFEAAPPDVVLFDACMPELDFPEAANRPFLVAVTDDNEGSRRRALELGADIHLPKPLDPSVLKELLERLQSAP